MLSCLISIYFFFICSSDRFFSLILFYLFYNFTIAEIPSVYGILAFSVIPEIMEYVDFKGFVYLYAFVVIKVDI